MGSVMLCNLPGEFSEGDKGTTEILGKPQTELGWRATCYAARRVAAAMAGREKHKAMPVRLHPPPHASLLRATLKAKGTPNTTNKTNPGTLLGVARMAEKSQRVPGRNAACTVSPTVPSNPDRPALPETNMAMYHHVGSCFHRNLPGLWTPLCKNYSFF